MSTMRLPPAKASRAEPKVPKDVELAIRQRVEKEKLAHRACERLIEPVSARDLGDLARFLHPSHYDAVLEERSCDLRCGYPCCDRRVRPFKPGQKFHISLRERRVYRTETVNRYCSEACAQASAEFMRTLSRVPVSQRDTVGADLRPKPAARPSASVLVGDVREKASGAVQPPAPPRPGGGLAARAIEGHAPRPRGASPRRKPPDMQSALRHEDYLAAALAIEEGSSEGNESEDAHGGDSAEEVGDDADEGPAPAPAPRRSRKAPGRAPSAGHGPEEPSAGLDLSLDVAPVTADLSPFGRLWNLLTKASTPATSAWLRARRATASTVDALPAASAPACAMVSSDERGPGCGPEEAVPAGDGAAGEDAAADAGNGGGAAPAGGSQGPPDGDQAGAGGRGGGGDDDGDLEALFQTALRLRAEQRDARRAAEGPPPLAAQAADESDATSQSARGAAPSPALVVGACDSEAEADGEGDGDGEGADGKAAGKRLGRTNAARQRILLAAYRARRQVLQERAATLVRAGPGDATAASAAMERLSQLLATLEMDAADPPLSSAEGDAVALVLLAIAEAPIDVGARDRVLGGAGFDRHHFAALQGVFSHGTA